MAKAANAPREQDYKLTDDEVERLLKDGANLVVISYVSILGSGEPLETIHFLRPTAQGRTISGETAEFEEVAGMSPLMPGLLFSWYYTGWAAKKLKDGPLLSILDWTDLRERFLAGKILKRKRKTIRTSVRKVASQLS